MPLLDVLKLANADLGERPRRALKGVPPDKLKLLERQISAEALGDRIDGIFALERTLRTALDRSLRPHGLSYAQYSLLRFINAPRDEHGYPSQEPVGPGQLQEYFDLQKRAISRTLDGLKRKKLVVAERGVDGDRRRVRLRLSDKAVSKLEAATRSVRTIGEALGRTGSREQDYASWHLVPRMLENVQRTR